jgi:chloramphenicol-sensitive protein RarD
MKSWREPTKGVVFATMAFTFWGFVPLYYRFVYELPPLEILAHRIVWTIVAIGIALLLSGRTRAFLAVFQQPKTLGYLAITSLLIGGNWLVFTWAVLSGHVLDLSMGYFINPLFNVVLGVAFLRERLRAAQIAAVGLATCGVAWLVVTTGSLPWVALALPACFGTYGLVRKRVEVDSLNGLLIETLFLTPLALGYIVYLSVNGSGSFGADRSVSGLLLLAGPITLIPLVLFAAGVRRINYSTVGFLQYIGPSISFVLGIFVFREEFGSAQFVTYALIWSALAVFTVESIAFTRRQLPEALGGASSTSAG